MREKRNKKSKIIWIICLGLVIAILYLIWSPSSKGVLVSCETQQIIDIKNTPSPLMQMVQSEFCKVNLTVADSHGNLVCQKYEGIFANEKGIISKDQIKKI